MDIYIKTTWVGHMNIYIKTTGWVTWTYTLKIENI
jgi:hypothetical protein